MLALMEQLHQVCSSNKNNSAPDKSFYILLTAKLLGLEIGNKTIKPIYFQSRWFSQIANSHL